MSNSINLKTMTKIALGVISASSLAANAGGITSWNNVGGGEWGLGANWTSGVVPTSSDAVSIALPGAYTVNIAGSRAAGTLSIANLDTILTMQFGSTLSMSGNIDNLGSIEINPLGAAAGTSLRAETDVTLGGTGRLLLGGDSTRSSITTLNGSTLNHGITHTIEGQGSVSALMTNNGLVSANVTGLQMLVNSFEKTNLGTFEAINGGIMEINGTTITQLGSGEIVAEGLGSQIELVNSAINGGDLFTLAGADIEAFGTNTLNDVSFSGLLNISHGTVTNLTGTWTNNGTVVLNSTFAAAGTTIVVGTSLTFDGTGSLNLTSIDTRSRLSTADGVVVTQGAGHTIFGQGRIEADLVNEGLISANSAGNQMLLNGNDKTNNATMQASDGGIMEINGVTITQGGGGQIVTDGAGSQVELVNAAVSGGTVKAGPDGDIEVLGTSFLSGVNSEGLMNIPHGNILRISDSWTNEGTVVVNSTFAAAATTMIFDDSMVIEGDGEINLTSVSTRSRIQTGVGSTVTQNPAHTIFGLGRIEASFVNNGLVSANTDGGRMVLNINDKFNNATMQAVGGGIMEINAVTIEQGPAGSELISDGAGSQIELINATVIGGDLLSMGGGIFESFGTSTLNGITQAGDFNILHGNIVNIENSIENNGVITLNSSGAAATTSLVFNDSSSMMGTGTLVLTRPSTQSRVTTAADQTMTHGANHSIEGQGRIEASMINNGLISANTDGAQLDMNANDKTNNGTLQAVGGGILEINAVTITQGPTGEIVADDAGSEVELVNATIVDGTLMSTGGAIFETNGLSILDGVELSGPLNVTFSSILGVKDGFTNNGLMVINSNIAGATTSMRWDDEFTIEGTGTIRLTRQASQARLIALGGKVTQGGLGSGQRLEGIGRVEIDLAMDGTLAPGLSIGTMTANLPIDLSGSASFEAEINGSTSDLLDSSSTVDVEGTLDVLFVDGFAPTEFWARTIIEGSEITGEFDAINAPTPPGSLVTRVNYTNTAVIVGQTCRADLAMDGVLDFFDVSDFLSKFAEEHPEADFTNDGEFDFFDVSDFLNEFGSGCNP